MTAKSRNQTPLVALMTGAMVCTSVPACRAGGGTKPLPPEQQARFEALQAEGAEASVTVFPVAIWATNKPEKRVGGIGQDAGKVLGVLLEQAGMGNLEVADSVFVLPADVDFDESPGRFGEFVRANPIKTDYALYAEIVGQTGNPPQFKEVRSVIVNKAGEAVWLDRQTRDDRAFKRAKPGCLMSCCVLLSERVRKQLRIPRSARDDSGEGRLARMFAESAPGADKAERNAMEKRQAVMKKAGRGVKVAVYPVRFSDEEVSQESAAQLVGLLNKKKLCKAEAVDSPLRVEIKPNHNEQKLLWDLADAFQAHIRQNPPESDYALLADYMMSRQKNRAHAVHFVVCDRAGEWVIVDFQNNHHGDFQSIDPKAPEDCGRLVAKRLKGYLR
jgi:hypothetical protein